MAVKVPGPTLTEKFRGLVRLIPDRFLAKYGINITKQKNPDDVAPSSLTGGILESNLTTEQTNEVLKTNTSFGGSLPATITDTRLTTDFGGGVLDVTQTISQGSLTVSQGLTTTESAVTDLGGVSEKTAAVLQDASWPILYGTHVDEQTKLTVDYTKQVVAAGTLGGISGSDYIEVEPIDKWRSLKITSTLRANTVPADTRYPLTQRESFPDELRDITFAVLFHEAVFGGGGYVNAPPQYNLVQGYSGPCNARVTEKYMTEAQYATWDTVAVGTIFPKRPSVTHFFPQANRIAVELGAGAALYTAELPMSLHPETKSVTGQIVLTVPATVPPELPYGSWIVVGIRPEKWRFGIRYIEIIEVQVPPNPDNE